MSEQVIPPMPTVPPAVRGETSWWHALYAPTPVLAETEAAPIEEPEAEPERLRSWAGRLPDWRKGETVDLDASAAEPEAVDEEQLLADEDEEEEEEEELEEPEDDEEQTKEQPGKPRWRSPGRSVRPRLTAPGSAITAPRRSLAEALQHLSRHHAWLLYQGSAAALGWGLGISPFVTDEITYLVHTSHGPTAPYCLFWYATAGLVTWADWRTRSWWPPLAWACRIPAASTVLGVLLYAPGH